MSTISAYNYFINNSKGFASSVLNGVLKCSQRSERKKLTLHVVTHCWKSEFFGLDLNIFFKWKVRDSFALLLTEKCDKCDSLAE